MLIAISLILSLLFYNSTDEGKHNKIYIALGSNLRSFSHQNVKSFFNSVIFRLELIGLKSKK